MVGFFGDENVLPFEPKSQATTLKTYFAYSVPVATRLSFAKSVAFRPHLTTGLDFSKGRFELPTGQAVTHQEQGIYILSCSLIGEPMFKDNQG